MFKSYNGAKGLKLFLWGAKSFNFLKKFITENFEII